MTVARVEEDLQIKWISFLLMYSFVLFSVLNRTWETVKRTGNKKGISADGKTVVTFFVCIFSFYQFF